MIHVMEILHITETIRSTLTLLLLWFRLSCKESVLHGLWFLLHDILQSNSTKEERERGGGGGEREGGERVLKC